MRDNGECVPVIKRMQRLPPVIFGHISSVVEGQRYSRQFLEISKAHRQSKKGVSGSIEFGCDSIVFSKNNAHNGERDGKFHFDFCNHITLFIIRTN